MVYTVQMKYYWVIPYIIVSSYMVIHGIYHNEIGFTILLGDIIGKRFYVFRQKFLKCIGLEPCVLVSPHRRKPSRGGPKC
jgi:hypothetical protein